MCACVSLHACMCLSVSSVFHVCLCKRFCVCIATFIQWCVLCKCAMYFVHLEDQMGTQCIQSLETRYMYRKLGTQIGIESVVCTNMYKCTRAF